MAECRLIGLIRVSTERQGQSGLGLEAQQVAIDEYQRRTGCKLLKVYREVESGKYDDLSDRPVLHKAIAHAKRAKATLVIGKLDRLVRSHPMLALLRKERVPFVACDNPSANEMTVDILVSVAVDERKKISLRTREAL